MYILKCQTTPFTKELSTDRNLAYDTFVGGLVAGGDSTWIDIHSKTFSLLLLKVQLALELGHWVSRRLIMITNEF